MSAPRKLPLRRWMLRLPPWLRLGAGVKRWLLLCAAGMGLIALGTALLAPKGVRELGFLALVVSGMLLTVGGVAAFARNLVRQPVRDGGPVRQSFGDRLYAMNVLDRGPAVVALGGGSGLSSLLRGLRQITANITAIVTVADDGGGSGMLREDLGMLPPGDIRNCVLALSQAEPEMEKLLQYRFHEGQLKGQNFGNLLLAAMADSAGGFLEGIRTVSDILNVQGRVLPVSLDDINLKARLTDGSVVDGESNIGMCQRTRGSRIERLWLDPAACRPVPEVLEAIERADLIVIGPGSLYTSLLPNLLVPGVADAVRRSSALKVYVMNLMTQPGETEGYGATEHLEAIRAHCGEGLMDVVLANSNTDLPASERQRYLEDDAHPIVCDRAAIEALGLRVVESNLLRVSNGRVRHSYSGLAAALSGLLDEKNGRGR